MMARALAPARWPWRAALPEWAPIGAGLLLLYLPTFYSLFHGIWATEEQAHGPIILALALWLIQRQWPRVLAAGTRPSKAGWLLLVPGLLLYIVGRSQAIVSFEIASLIVLPAALLLIKRGAGALAALWFPFVFLCFMVPLPGPLVALLTLPMKTAVSYVTEHLLYAAGYPVARSGVILQVGQYQLLVADACAGLQTLLSLEALGLFYLNLVRHTSLFRNVALACCIVPISFAANVVRVVALSLVTYYLGDAAGRGFLHGFAGMLLFLTALALILALDALLQWRVGRAGALA